MKKQNVLFIVLFCLTTSVFAQDFITFGVRGGFNYTTVSGDYSLGFYDYWMHEYPQARTDKSKSLKPGFNIGIDALHKLNDKMALQAELFYSREGYKGNWTFDYEVITKGEFKDQYSFLNLPVFFKYNFTKHFYAMGGPQVSLLLSAKFKGESQVNGGALDERELDLTDRMNKIGVGLTPAVGYDLNKMSFSLRYYTGLMSLVKSNNYDMDIKNQVLSVVVSYKVYGLKK